MAKKINLRKIIKAQLLKREISVPQLARQIGCNQQTLYDFLAGRKALTADYLQAVLNTLGAQLTFEPQKP